MSKKEQVLDGIIAQGMLPLFFYEDEQVSLEVVRTLYKAGVRVIEYTNRGEAALDNFTVIKKAQQIELPGLYIGAGTVKTVTEAEAFMAAGADFIVSPIINAEVGKTVHRHNLLWVPGCMTPTEIFNAQQNDAALIKIFPASILGLKFLNAIKELFPGQCFVPTGGVELTTESISAWFNAGVCAVGFGSQLISKEVLDNKLYDQLYNDTILATEIIQSCK
ncbi:bifunctional 4-hydroxy-2-oxoglutarate aldolase/2-dehydro-3-deoxy-phosphogluconate aldolase [Mucilaginibacter limnophilus]|uniref:Bifunctional 4-hydroxy-2-oxoglutarate aldolase/2-dehydro-3-deoxy-phosphogluconate aldolase n=1 Tax=Mucilaginibacter limnophilus TaxID=1932778 RepID=A0A437MRJ9_9SPHI|nr:bifunctional 4-hydroxy-2-oxoglutarate aldolase/2-dehydro-3-deoxy-phosphogluconate aldolase [Mucilaginibacter limnophilus]RVU00269.1 bifunctional 4-hydroxy-2-oxoglutarate aldolase/2-dehydro-3-deoxy-phosphogluconate aldolase [Mucilaginibacter limnophilus]